MTVEAGASGRIDIRATHFGPKGELLVNPTEVPKPNQPEKRGLFGGLLGRLRHKELPKQPEGPKHVLESIRKTRLADRLEKVTQLFYEMRQDAYESDRGMCEETYGSAYHARIKLANIEERRAERAKKAEETPPAPIAEIPQPLNQIIENLNKAAGSSGEVSIGSLSLEHDSLKIITDRGIRIELRLPGIMSIHNEIYFSIDARSLGNNPELLQQIKAIEGQFSDQASLLGISEILIQYAEQVTSKLPEENDIRIQEVQKEKQREIETWAERDRIKAERERTQRPGTKKERTRKKKELSNEEKQALEELRIRHPDNPLFKTELREVPEGFVEVISTVPERALDSIGEQGLIPMRPKETSEQESFMEDHMPESVRAKYPTLSRLRSTFAHPDIGRPKNFVNEVALSLMVDPDKVFVADAAAYTEAAAIFNPVWAEHYWEEAMTLREFLALPAKEKSDRFPIPEVLIPGGVKPELIRVDHVTIGKPTPKSQ